MVPRAYQKKLAGYTPDSSVSCQPPMFENCFFESFCDSLMTLSSRRRLLGMVSRSVSRLSFKIGLVGSTEVCLSIWSAPGFKRFSAEVFAFGCDCSG